GPFIRGTTVPASPTGGQLTSWAGTISLSGGGIPDGTSNTLLIGEKHIRYTTVNGPGYGTNEDRSVMGFIYNSFFRFGGIASTDQSLRPLQIYSPAPTWNIGAISNQAFGSLHQGVCQFVLCDGSTRAISTDVDINTLTNLCNRYDGQTVRPY